MFDRLNPHSLTGLTPGQGSAATSYLPGVGRSAMSAADDKAPLWHPDNPLFWFAGLAAVTLGLIAANSSLRVGPFKGSLSAGKSK